MNYFVAGSAVFLAAISATLHAAPPTTWASRGIGGGGALYSPTINPGNPREMSVACDMSPLFTSLDSGKSWTTTDFRQIQSGHEGAVHYTKDPQIRWTMNYSPAKGEDRARPVRSADGGKTWQGPAEPAWPSARIAYVLCTDFDHPERAIVSADYGELWMTTDGGKTFEKKITGTNKDTGLHLAGAFFDGDTIYAGLNDGLYVSTDGGKTFGKSSIPGLPAGEFMVSFAGAKSGGKARLVCVVLKNGYAGINGEEFRSYDGVYVLDPEQNAWVMKSGGMVGKALPYFVGMAANDINTMYVAGGSDEGRTGPSVYKSIDGGEHWADVFQVEGNRNIAVGWAGDGGDFGWSFPEYALGFEVCRSDPNHLMVTDLSGAHASDDGGKSWREIYTSPVGGLSVGEGKKDRSYVGNGLEVTSIWQLLWFDKNDVFACATDVRGFRSVDAGKSWSFNYTGDTMNSMYHAVTDPASKTTYAAVSSIHDMYESTYLQDKRIDKGKGAVLSTTDHGATWKPVGNLGKPVVWVALDPKNPSRLYASVVNSGEGGIYRCDNPGQGAGASWKKLSAPPRTQGHPYNIQVLDDGTLVCTYSGRRDGNPFTQSSGVFVSGDSGETWDDKTDFRMAFWTKDLVIDPADKTQSTWYAGVFHAWGKTARDGREGIYRTTDRGEHWTLLATAPLAPSGTLNVESCAFDPAHPGNFYFTTEYDGLFFCPDVRVKNPQFKQVESYPFKHPLRVEFNPTKSGEMWVTSFGNGLRVGETNPNP